MNETKPFWMSKGIIGGAVAAVAAFTGLVIDPMMLQHSMVLVSNVVAGVGGLVAVWGRWVADKKVG